MRASLCLLVFSLLALPVHAGEPKIVETDSEIIVEINGGEEDRLATQKQVEEREKAAAKELETQQRKQSSAARRAAAKKDSEKE